MFTVFFSIHHSKRIVKIYLFIWESLIIRLFKSAGHVLNLLSFVVKCISTMDDEEPEILTPPEEDECSQYDFGVSNALNAKLLANFRIVRHLFV